MKEESSRSAIKHCHNVPSCSSASCWKAGRRATGEDTGHHSTTEPQPPTPQHAVTHHANDLLVLDQLHTNHTACTDWTVERLMASINDETSHRGRATVWWTDRTRSSCTTHHQLLSADTQSTVRRAESTISLSHHKDVTMTMMMMMMMFYGGQMIQLLELKLEWWFVWLIILGLYHLVDCYLFQYYFNIWNGKRPCNWSIKFLICVYPLSNRDKHTAVCVWSSLSWLFCGCKEHMNYSMVPTLLFDHLPKILLILTD